MGWDDTFASRLINRDLTIGVIGLGYVGLPTALGFLDAGFRVRGVDVTQRVIDALSRGENPGDDPQHDDIIPQSQDENWLVSTNSADLVPQCDVVLVTVPTPVTEERLPDLSYVSAAGSDVFSSISPNSGQ